MGYSALAEKVKEKVIGLFEAMGAIYEEECAAESVPLVISSLVPGRSKVNLLLPPLKILHNL